MHIDLKEDSSFYREHTSVKMNDFNFIVPGACDNNLIKGLAKSLRTLGV